MIYANVHTTISILIHLLNYQATHRLKNRINFTYYNFLLMKVSNFEIIVIYNEINAISIFEYSKRNTLYLS